MAPMHTISDDLALLHTLLDLAEGPVLKHFRALACVEDKGEDAFDPVTAADRDAEAAIREHLAHVRGEDGVIGEEFEDRPSRSGRNWIIDPIDGTRAYIAGLPTFGTLVGLHDGADVTAGGMSQPVVGERYVGNAEGATLHDRSGHAAMRTRRCARLADAAFATTSPDLFSAAQQPAITRLREAARMTRYGTDCYAYALLSAGHIDVVVETGLKAVDIAPFVALVRAAGGVLTDFSGAPLGPTLATGYGGEAVAVGDEALLPQVLAILNG